MVSVSTPIIIHKRNPWQSVSVSSLEIKMTRGDLYWIQRSNAEKMKANVGFKEENGYNMYLSKITI